MKKFYPNLRSIQIKSGLWTVGIVIILIFGYLWLSGTLNLKNQREIQIAFADVMGLETGDKVMYRGMEVGRVKNIRALGDAIICTIRIASGIKLVSGSRFSISDSSLMGGKSLQIIPGNSNTALNPRQIQRGEAPEGVMELIGKASLTLQEIQELILRIKGPEGLLVNSENLITQAGSTLNKTEGMAAEVKTGLNATLEKVTQLTTELQELVQVSRIPLQNTLEASPVTLVRINSTLDSLQVLSASLQSTAQALNSGQGTAGKLMTDKQLYDNLTRSVENLDALVKDIKANPKKYVKFSLF
ncbi:MAG TPA: MlaD family protein [Candidatus Cloacimonas sp.]|nr:MlaD family protein [Candidatus Cloacimonas sp.]